MEGLWRGKRVLINIILILCVVAVLILVSINFAKKIFPLTHQDTVNKYSMEYDIDPYMIYSIIKAESNFKRNATSPKNARGLMQIAEITGNWGSVKLDIDDFKLEDLYKVDTNIMLGCWYLNMLNKEFGDNKETILAAYNAGSGNVSKWLKNPKYSEDGINLIEDNIPFNETKRYLKRVRIYEKIYRILYKNLD